MGDLCPRRPPIRELFFLEDHLLPCTHLHDHHSFEKTTTITDKRHQVSINIPVSHFTCQTFHWPTMHRHMTLLRIDSRVRISPSRQAPSQYTYTDLTREPSQKLYGSRRSSCSCLKYQLSGANDYVSRMQHVQAGSLGPTFSTYNSTSRDNLPPMTHPGGRPMSLSGRRPMSLCGDVHMPRAMAMSACLSRPGDTRMPHAPATPACLTPRR
ncbi:hypothetical protein VNO80_13240 [Phaseolus coccineus]|uniref:Uncharacterized protein n=1 Tax=Phaseolus coccineus TaxID=3886 RepID=A0AAN9N0L8_PHACN